MPTSHLEKAGRTAHRMLWLVGGRPLPLRRSHFRSAIFPATERPPAVSLTK
jgi:hypothetical protein